MIKPSKKCSIDMSFTEAARAFPKRNDLYAYMLHHFAKMVPEPVRSHRQYNNQTQRGFGEDAFHAMWWLLFREFKPVECVEIGVYRGQIISLWALIAKLLDYHANISGVSPFEPVVDSTTKYSEGVDYIKDTLETFKRYGLDKPTLVKAHSQGEVALDHLASKRV